MKNIPFTDKLLLMLCKTLKGAEEFFDAFTPRTMKMVCYPDFYKLKRQYDKQKTKKPFNQFSQSVFYLKKKGYIQLAKKDEKHCVLITKRGAERILGIKFKMAEKKKRADKKWLMITFDIPEEKRTIRNLFRRDLQFLEYQMLQKSIWICPYDVRKETEWLIRKYALYPYVRIFLTKEIKI